MGQHQEAEHVRLLRLPPASPAGHVTHLPVFPCSVLSPQLICQSCGRILSFPAQGVSPGRCLGACPGLAPQPGLC